MLLVIGLAFLILLAAAFARYTTFDFGLNYSDRTEAHVFFIVVGLPFVIAGLILIAGFVLRV